jgi:hypothetical protein
MPKSGVAVETTREKTTRRGRQTWEDGIKDVLKRKGMDMTHAKNWEKDRARLVALCKPSILIRRRGSD